MFGPGSVVDMVNWDCTFDDGWSDVVWFFWFTTHLMPYWGIFPFWLIFVDLHGVACSSPLTKYTPRRWPICYLIMISQGSLSWAIQSNPHFLIFGCPHAFSFERCLLICGFDSAVDLDDWDHVFDDGWFKGVRFSDITHVWCHSGAYVLFGWDL